MIATSIVDLLRKDLKEVINTQHYSVTATDLVLDAALLSLGQLIVDVGQVLLHLGNLCIRDGNTQLLWELWEKCVDDFIIGTCSAMARLVQSSRHVANLTSSLNRMLISALA